MKRFAPIALCVLLAVVMSPAVRAVAQPLPQDVAGTTVGAAPPPRSRPPLFQVRYVLVKATQQQDDPPIDLGSSEPAIRAQTFSGWPGAQLNGGTYKPNTIICYGWSCMDSRQR
jgi:hypothetical protein